MRKRVLLLIICLLTFFSSHGKLAAYHPDVHKKITINTIDQMANRLNAYFNDYIGERDYLRKLVWGKSMRNWIEDGSWWEDVTIGSPLDLLTSHYYNPYTNKGLTEAGITIGVSAYDRANDPNNFYSWKNARQYFYQGLTSTIEAGRDLCLANSFEILGHVVHLIQDMSIPAHTRDDMHVPYVDGEPYELYTKNNWISLNYNSVSFPYWNVSISPNAPKQFWDLDSYDGTVAYDSGYIGLSEYTHANFFSKDTIFKYFPHPARENTNYYDFGLLPTTVITTPDNINHNTFYISGYGKQHLAALKYFAGELWNLPIPLPRVYQLTLHLDNRCHEEYAQYLVPRAVGYSAGLLDYFFRGTIAITLPATGVYAQTENRAEGFKKITLNAQNTSPVGEEMTDGTIELVIKYRLAQEDPFQSYPVPTTWEYSYMVIPAPNGIRSIPRASPVKLEFDLSQNPIPINATDLYLQVVYRGKLGQEEGAVAVGFKDISEPTPIDIFNDMDRVCINGNWYVAGSQEAIDLAKQFYFDPYPHNLQNIYMRFSSSTDPKYASPTEYNLYIPSLSAGQFYIRQAFVLTDYQFSQGYRQTVINADGRDPFISWIDPGVVSHNGLKNQTEYVTYDQEDECALFGLSAPCSIYMRYYPLFHTFRDQLMWFQFTYENNSYPADSSCP